MIQFNLLPDVKLQYVKARRTKRTVMVVAGLATGVTLTIFLALFMVVKVAQKQHLSNLNRDIERDSAQLQAMPEINKILTVQNQLSDLTDLHNNKPVASRLFGYLTQITPPQVSISKLNVDFAEQKISITGDADTLNTVNKFIDTIKFTDFVQGEEKSKPFSNVVLVNFSRNEQGASYEIELNFDPAIFDSSSGGQLTVPKIITTRSELEKPGALFQQQNSEEPAGQ
jgi:hypothetical protein